MTRRLVIVGCGGFGREVFSIVDALGADCFEVEGFADDDPSEEDRCRVAKLGSEIIGTVDDLVARTTPYSAVVAIGSPTVRAQIVNRLDQSPVSYPSLIHPDASVGSLVTVAAGSVVCPGARLSTNITIGSHVHVDQNATIGHDSRVGDFARLNPQSCISGSVLVANGAVIGAGATVLPGLTVGPYAVVGAAACVVRDVPELAVVKGVPAR